MADDPRVPAFERLVREWTGRVHALAYRMLGNRADAEDATQEVFLRLWNRIDAYDPTRPFQPWIYQVATRSILNRIRGEGTRARKQAAVRPAPPPESTEAAVERREAEAAVHDALQRIEGDARALLAMHYYGGLTQDEISEVLDAPRTTVQSRLARALDGLRASLARSTSLAVLPGLEDLMRGTPPPPVDERLVASLLKIATPAGATAASATGAWLIGGMLVTKKLILGAALLLLLGAGGGVLAQRALRGASVAEGPPTAAAELARLTEENRRLKADLERRGPESPRLAGAESRGASSTAPTSRGPVAALTEAASAPSAPGSALDWSRFSKLFAANAAKVAEMVAKDGEEKLDPADRALMLSIFVEYMHVCAEARALTPHPFFDDRVLPDLTVALFGDTFELSPERRKALEDAARASLQAHRGEIDLESAGPLEALALRARISDEVIAAAGDGLEGSASAKLKSLQPMVRAMLLGDTTEVRIGLAGGAKEGEAAASAIVAEWKEAYGLDDRQADAARPLAARYARDAADVLRRHGLDVTDENASEADRAAARAEMLRLGVAAERTILGDLSATQRAAAARRPPTIVTLKAGDGIQRSTMNAGGL